MTYAELNLGFLALALLPLAAAALARRLERSAVLGIAACVAALFVLTAVFDNVMIGVGLFSYDAATLAGPRIGLAPLGDFAYPLAAGILLPAAWLLLGRGSRERP